MPQATADWLRSLQASRRPPDSAEVRVNQATDWPRPWLAHYPPGVSHALPPDAPVALTPALLAACRRWPERTAFVQGNHRISYAELDRRSRDLAAWLRHGAGLSPGARVALMMPNLIAFPLAMLAVLRAGLVLVNVNPMYTPRELAHQLHDSGAEAIIVLDLFAHTLEQVKGPLPLKKVVVVGVGDLMPAPMRWITHFVVRRVEKLVPDYDLPGAVGLREALRHGAGLAYTDHETQADDVALLQYTGGTTGVAKGATLTQRALATQAASVSAWFGGVFAGKDDLMLTCLPLYHIAAFSVACVGCWLQGGTNVLIANPRDIASVIAAYRRHRPTINGGVTALFEALMASPEFLRLDFSRMRFTLQGSTALRRATAERWQLVTGCAIHEAYGMSETAGACIANPPLGENRIGSIGLPMPGVDVRILDESGRDLPEGEAGELCTRSEMNLRDYWQRPTETGPAFHPGRWLRTGDIARMDHEGYVHILDRLKDMLKVSGFNVYPNEIEDVLALHPGIAEAAVVGVPDPRTGEAVKAVIVRRDPALDAEAVRDYCRQHLTGYKRPTLIEFRDSLPKTNVGKVIRRALREA
jgi:long-chain acyl-CoA synthetase